MEQAAFMGYGPDDFNHSQIGAKFAGETENGVLPGDVILIARRHNHEPEIVGFGVVKGDYSTKARQSKPPQEFGSLRRLSPFRPWSRPPSGVPLIDALQYAQSLVRLHPESNETHRKVCDWIEKQLARKSGRAVQKASGKAAQKAKPGAKSPTLSLVDMPESHQLDYKVQTRSSVIKAKKVEAELVKGYSLWLDRQGRKLVAAKYTNLQCDGYEEDRKNLIEAKSSTTREHIRMAVGQLLDYAFQGREKLGVAHKAILLPKKPSSDMVAWLEPLKISIIWREGRVFLDDANGQFT